MGNLDKKILTITKPTIPIEQMDQADTSDPNAPLQSNENKFKKAGAIWPIISINRYSFNENGFDIPLNLQTKSNLLMSP